MKRWRIVTALLLIAVIGVSGWQLWTIHEDNERERRMHGEALQFKPPGDSDGRENPQIAALRAKHPDAVGWLCIPGTRVDYPFVQAQDNSYYLRRDLNGEPAQAGTIFMDYRCDPGFGGLSTILYGHHMRSGSMFRDVSRFGGAEFFEQHKTGEIILLDRNITLEFFACAVVKADDRVIYSQPRTGEEQDALLLALKAQAKQSRDIGVTAADRIVLLSTCSYQFDGARTVLAGRVRG